jgi:hypothetical protein
MRNLCSLSMHFIYWWSFIATSHSQIEQHERRDGRCLVTNISKILKTMHSISLFKYAAARGVDLPVCLFEER